MLILVLISDECYCHHTAPRYEVFQHIWNVRPLFPSVYGHMLPPDWFRCVCMLIAKVILCTLPLKKFSLF
jgi:hypothetical protein